MEAHASAAVKHATQPANTAQPVATPAFFLCVTSRTVQHQAMPRVRETRLKERQLHTMCCVLTLVNCLECQPAKYD